MLKRHGTTIMPAVCALLLLMLAVYCSILRGQNKLLKHELALERGANMGAGVEEFMAELEGALRDKKLSAKEIGTSGCASLYSRFKAEHGARKTCLRGFCFNEARALALAKAYSSIIDEVKALGAELMRFKRLLELLDKPGQRPQQRKVDRGNTT